MITDKLVSDKSSLSGLEELFLRSRNSEKARTEIKRLETRQSMVDDIARLKEMESDQKKRALVYQCDPVMMGGFQAAQNRRRAAEKALETFDAEEK